MQASGVAEPADNAPLNLLGVLMSQLLLPVEFERSIDVTITAPVGFVEFEITNYVNDVSKPDSLYITSNYDATIANLLPEYPTPKLMANIMLSNNGNLTSNYCDTYKTKELPNLFYVALKVILIFKILQ